MWVDIIAAEAHRVFLDDDDYEKRHQVIRLEDPHESIGALCLTKNDDIILICTKYGVSTADFRTGATKVLVEYNHTAEQRKRLRSNDGIIDPHGNLWIGVMSDFTAGGVIAEGFLYRIDCKDLSVKVMVKDVFISNGLAFSADATTLYWTDTLTFKLWQFDYDPQTATLSNRRPCIDYKEIIPDVSDPGPDGLAMTKNGTVYAAIYGGSRVVKVTTDGKVHGKVTLPARCITCVCAGGKNDDTLFINTATIDHEENPNRPDASDKSGDLGGYLFQVKVDEKLHGAPKYIWGGDVDN